MLPKKFCEFSFKMDVGRIHGDITDPKFGSD